MYSKQHFACSCSDFILRRAHRPPSHLLATTTAPPPLLHSCQVLTLQPQLSLSRCKECVVQRMQPVYQKCLEEEGRKVMREAVAHKRHLSRWQGQPRAAASLQHCVLENKNQRGSAKAALQSLANAERTGRKVEQTGVCRLCKSGGPRRASQLGASTLNPHRQPPCRCAAHARWWSQSPAARPPFWLPPG